LSPSWSRVIFLDGYKFGVPLYFEVGVFDFDATQTGKSERELSRMDVHSQALLTSAAISASGEQMRDGKFPHKVMGTALFEVGQVLGARGNVGSKSLQTGGVLTVHVEKCDANSSSGGGSSGRAGGRLHLHLRGWKLANVQSLGRTSSPFYELYRKVDRPTGATWESVYRSNTVSADLSPLWTEVNLDLEATCNSDLNRAMKMIVWDHRRSGKHKMMGEMETTVQGILDQAKEGAVFEIVRDAKTVGTIQVVRANLIMPPSATKSPNSGGGSGGGNKKEAPRSPTRPAAAAVAAAMGEAAVRPEFVDYLSGGCQISLAVAIDFTASNGDPRQPGTPHYFHPPESKEWNDYEKAIFAVGSILAKYDSDQKFPVWVSDILLDWKQP
jgi:C2 domain/Copine